MRRVKPQDKLRVLIEEAEEMAEKIHKELGYDFYHNLAIDLRYIQRDLDKQDITEELDRSEE